MPDEMTLVEAAERLDVDRAAIDAHNRHMTDGRWHDDCRYCRNRRRFGGTGVDIAFEGERSYG